MSWDYVLNFSSTKIETAGEKAGKKYDLQLPFFVDGNGQKVDKFVIIWKSKKLRCFRNMKDRDLNQPLGVHCFFNKKP